MCTCGSVTVVIIGTACAPGTFKDAQGPGPCTKCSEGKFASIPGAVRCVDCQPGTWQLLPILSRPEPSPRTRVPGFVAHSEGQPTCTACSLGKAWGTEGGRECVECTPGRYASQPASIRCKLCPTGTITVAGMTVDCVKCKPGMTVPHFVWAIPMCLAEGLFPCAQVSSPTLETQSARPAPTARALRRAREHASPALPVRPSQANRAHMSPRLTTPAQAALHLEATVSIARLAHLPCKTLLLAQVRPPFPFFPRASWSLTRRARVACPVGTFNNVRGRSECMTCSGGTVAPERGMTACTTCKAGTASLGANQTVCAGDCCGATPTKRAEHLLTHARIAECTPGRFANLAESSECTVCPAGEALLCYIG